MRTRSGLVALVFTLGAMVSAVPASADIYLTEDPDAPETTCAGSYDGLASVNERTCTFPAVGGKVFVVGGFGLGVYTIQLEVANDVPGLPNRVIARCDGSAMNGCIGGRGYNVVGIPAGTPLVCRGWGVGSLSFECSSFQVD